MASLFHALDGKMIERIIPRNDQVLIEKLELKKSKGGILLPENRKNDLPTEHGRIVAVADGPYLHPSGERVEITLKVGDEVMFQAWPSGCEVKEWDDKGEPRDYLLIPDKQVVAVLHKRK